MPTEVIMPQMGESIFEGTITKWLKKPGDTMQRDEPLFEISTDKVDAEIPAPSAGVLKEIKVAEGQTVPVQTVVAVIDANEPEEAEVTAAELTDALRKDEIHFRTARRPDASPYFQKEGLLFLDLPQLSSIMDKTIDAQPFLGQLVADPTARGLFSALSLLGMGVTKGDVDLAPYMTSLEAFHQSMADALAGHPRPLSWQLLLGGGLFLIGFLGCAWVVWDWVSSGFGPLHQVRAVLFWSMWLFLGIQVTFASFFLSMLGISRGTYIGDYDLK